MMNSLGSDGTRGSRFEDVEVAFEKTFSWVYEQPELGLLSWLEAGKGAYWISGKPGSGKSTLLKYICKDRRTRQALRCSRKEGKHVTPTFFFHDRGSHVQKSYEGLLRTILFEILSDEPSLQETILPIYQDRPSSLQNMWAQSDLDQAFGRILEQQVCPINIHLFLDALDEYEGGS